MKEKGEGNIVNISSISGGKHPAIHSGAYAAAKAGLVMLSEQMSLEWGKLGIRVNAVSPGFIDTDMFRSGPEEIQKQLVDGVYLGNRVGQSSEVADVCEFLASDKSSYVNGENIRIDGFSHI